jgi:hypothetical protein
MATATRRGQFWSARWRDATGRWREKRTKCRTKTEALVLARDLEHKADRQRLGLEPLPDRRAGMSFEDLSWWWKEYGTAAGARRTSTRLRASTSCRCSAGCRSAS